MTTLRSGAISGPAPLGAGACARRHLPGAWLHPCPPGGRGAAPGPGGSGGLPGTGAAVWLLQEVALPPAPLPSARPGCAAPPFLSCFFQLRPLCRWNNNHSFFPMGEVLGWVRLRPHAQGRAWVGEERGGRWWPRLLPQGSCSGLQPLRKGPRPPPRSHPRHQTSTTQPLCVPQTQL